MHGHSLKFLYLKVLSSITSSLSSRLQCLRHAESVSRWTIHYRRESHRWRQSWVTINAMLGIQLRRPQLNCMSQKVQPELFSPVRLSCPKRVSREPRHAGYHANISGRYSVIALVVVKRCAAENLPHTSLALFLYHLSTSCLEWSCRLSIRYLAYSLTLSFSQLCPLASLGSAYFPLDIPNALFCCIGCFKHWRVIVWLQMCGNGIDFGYRLNGCKKCFFHETSPIPMLSFTILL